MVAEWVVLLDYVKVAIEVATKAEELVDLKVAAMAELKAV